MIMVRIQTLDMEFEQGSNLMVLGPPLIGKSALVKNIFYEFCKQDFKGIYITTKDLPGDILRWFESLDGEMEMFGIIDCVSKTMSDDRPDEEWIKGISVMDLTGISVKLNGFLEKYWRAGDKNVVLVFDKLSTLLMYCNLQMVFRFLHILASRVKSTGAIAFYIIEEGMHEETTTATLKQLLDGAIELKEGESSRFFRLIGATERTDWREFYLKDNRIIVNQCMKAL